MKFKCVFFAIATMVGICSFSLGHSQSTPQKETQPPPQPASQPGNQQSGTHQAGPQDDDGDRIFRQNCSRCHAAPDSFSPRISGTILRHMRVRASLSQHDEQELLRFLNP
ncbi:hypothetical protein [Acidisarcina polymorpha]|uniref:hypothetical protein n=1 Tax=Acidisarcina polymorpha TaxID=2211140 RepID=UPI001F238F59|nr:hypothetical protein [Acidisarcina polymorpha]